MFQMSGRHGSTFRVIELPRSDRIGKQDHARFHRNIWGKALRAASSGDLPEKRVEDTISAILKEKVMISLGSTARSTLSPLIRRAPKTRKT